MAKAFKGSLTGTALDGGNVTLNLTAINLVGGGTGAVAEGDLVIVLGHVPEAGGLPGWGGFGTVVVNPLSSGNGKAYVSYKKMTASPDTSVTFTGSGTGTSGVTAMAYVFSGADFDTSVAHTTATNPAATNPDPAAITPDENATGVVVAAASTVTDAAITVPTNYVNMITTTANDTADSTIATAWRDGRPSGVSENPAAFTAWASGSWACVTLCIIDAAAVVATMAKTRVINQAVKRAASW